jgi:hypothetical protein
MTTATSPATRLAVNEILRIAQQDAERVYRDLSGMRISIYLCTDGWHVEYDHTVPLMAGGGPYYVIDPETGAIVSKCYYQ